MSNQRDLTDVQWAVLDPLIPKPKCRKDGRGRPWRERREVLNGILFKRSDSDQSSERRDHGCLG